MTARMTSALRATEGSGSGIGLFRGMACAAAIEPADPYSRSGESWRDFAQNHARRALLPACGVAFRLGSAPQTAFQEPAMSDDGVMIGFSDHPEMLRLDRANRHGFVAGATGTGKTVTLQVLAQGFSDAGVPVFAADVKGDLCGIAIAGQPKDKLLARAQSKNF